MRAKRPDPFDLVEGGQEVLQMPRQAGGLALGRHVDRRAHLERDRGGKVVLARLVPVEDARDDGAAFGRRRRGPGREGGLGGGNGAVGIGGRTERDDRADILGRRVDDRVILRRKRLHPGSADVEVAFLDHDSSPLACARQCQRRRAATRGAPGNLIKLRAPVRFAGCNFPLAGLILADDQ